MKILVSNDDGFLAPGIHSLADHLKEIADIIVMAPDRNHSGASNSLTLDRPLKVTPHEDNYFSVNGTPTDCVHLALTGFFEVVPDMVISGINEGSNLSDDVLYSGTVAAAMEGRFLGLPSIAVSLKGDQHYATAAKVVCKIVASLTDHPLPQETILNINVPDVPYEALQGIQVTKLGKRHLAEPLCRREDPRGNKVYWIGLPGEVDDGSPGTDFHAVKHNFVSVTPLQLDLSNYNTMESIQTWVDERIDL